MVTNGAAEAPPTAGNVERPRLATPAARCANALAVLHSPRLACALPRLVANADGLQSLARSRSALWRS